MLKFQQARRKTHKKVAHSLRRTATTGSEAFSAVNSGFSRLEHLNTTVRRSVSHSALIQSPVETQEPVSNELSDTEKAALEATELEEDKKLVLHELLLWETDPLLAIHDFGDLTSFWAVSSITECSFGLFLTEIILIGQ